MSGESLLCKLTPGSITVNNAGTSRQNRQLKPGTARLAATETRNNKPVTVSSADVAAALSGLDSRPYYYALARYADDSNASNVFWGLFEEFAHKLWPSITAKQAKVIALLSLEGFLWFIHCPRCQGRTVIYNRQRVARDCDKCRKTGKGKINGARAGEMLGVSGTAYRKTWDNRVAILQSVLTEYDDKALAHLRKKFAVRRGCGQGSFFEVKLSNN